MVELRTKDEIIADLNHKLFCKEMECEALNMKISVLEESPITLQTSLWDSSDVTTDYELIIYLLYNRTRELLRDVHARDVQLDALTSTIKRKKGLSNQELKELKRQNELIKREQELVKSFAKKAQKGPLKLLNWESDEDEQF